MRREASLWILFWIEDGAPDPDEPSELTRRRGSPLFEESSYEMPQPVPELMAALKQLSPNQRLAIVLHDYADRPTGEVAAVLECSRATVHAHLSQGRRRIQD